MKSSPLRVVVWNILEGLHHPAQPGCPPQADEPRWNAAKALVADAMRIDDAHFSQTDFRHGHGYLVDRGRLLYQHGSDHPVAWIGDFEEDNEPVALTLSGQSGGAVAAQMASTVTPSAWNRVDAEGLPVIQCDAPPPRVWVGPR